MSKYAVVSGGFDPLHVGHARLIDAAAKYGPDGVVAIVNGDGWLRRKKGYLISGIFDRLEVVSGLRNVVRVLPSNSDDETVARTLKMVCEKNPHDTFTFCNGGDRSVGRVPEESLDLPNLKFAYRVGGEDKPESSSLMPQRAAVRREWGTYVDHVREERRVVKTLHVSPGRETSYQRHTQRAEWWIVESGSGEAIVEGERRILIRGEMIHVPKGAWHQIRNVSDVAELKILELQLGIHCREEDIERRG